MSRGVLDDLVRDQLADLWLGVAQLSSPRDAAIEGSFPVLSHELGQLAEIASQRFVPEFGGDPQGHAGPAVADLVGQHAAFLSGGTSPAVLPSPWAAPVA